MALMKNDMGGAAAVIAATFAIAALELPVAVTTYAPMAENMVSGAAMRPGDVLTMRNGKTVEVTNTDAEGRLILADALALAVEGSPDAVVDVATLTGGCVVALGEKVAGLMGGAATTAAISAAAEASGEMLWPLPIPDESRTAVTESKIADVLQANWVRWGGTLYAAAFLEQFVGETPWAHLDIAGPAWASSAWGHVPTGATGFGITTLVEYAASLAGRRTGSGLTGLALGVGPLEQVLLLLGLAPVVLPHARGDADQRRVVGRDAVAVGEVVGPLHRGDASPGPLPVVGHQQEGHVGDGRARLDEPLDTAVTGDELRQVALVVAVGGADRDQAVGPRASSAAAEAIEQAHATSVRHAR